MNVYSHLISATACIKTIAPRKAIIGKVKDALPADQLPVTTFIGNGLFSVYLIDEGDHFNKNRLRSFVIRKRVR